MTDDDLLAIPDFLRLDTPEKVAAQRARLANTPVGPSVLAGDARPTSRVKKEEAKVAAKEAAELVHAAIGKGAHTVEALRQVLPGVDVEAGLEELRKRKRLEELRARK